MAAGWGRGRPRLSGLSRSDRPLWSIWGLGAHSRLISPNGCTACAHPFKQLQCSQAHHRPVALISLPQALRAERLRSNMAAGKPLLPPPLASIRQPVLVIRARCDRRSTLPRATVTADRIQGARPIGFTGGETTWVGYDTDAGGLQLRSMNLVNAVQKVSPRTYFSLVLALSSALLMWVGFLVLLLGEALGGSGCVLALLQKRWSALRSDLILGAVGVAWHRVPPLVILHRPPAASCRS